MRKLTYVTTAALFALGLIFVASYSHAEKWEEYYGAQFTGYSEPSMAWDTFDARGVLGTDLRTSNGSVIGHIDDFIIDPSTERISFLMVSDVTGLGAERVAVPFSKISKSGPDILVYNPPEDYQLQYGVPSYVSYGLNRFLGEPIPAEAYEAHRVFGATIQTSDRQEAGRVEDFVFASDGHVVYLVLTDVGGVENRMAAVPISAVSRSGETFALNITKDRLMTAPAFAWSNTNDRRYAENLYRHYGLQPYWEMREEVGPGAGTEPGGRMHEGTQDE